jgi:hypothetical protein
MRSRLPFVAASLCTAGCVSIPDASIIQDLRILDLRVEPAEIAVFKPAPPVSTAQDLLSLAPNAVDVKVTAVVAHPDLDATFEYEWVRCKPGLDRVPCSGDDRERLFDSMTSSVADVQPVPIVFADAAMAAEMSGGGAQAGLFGALSTFASDPRDLLNGLYAYINLHVSVVKAAVPVDSPSLEGTKRFVIFDPQIVRVAINEARMLGTMAIPAIEGYDLPSLCTNVSREQLDVIFDYLLKRTPNQPPTYASLELQRVTDTASSALGIDEVLMLAPGESVKFRGRAAPGDKEAFQLIDDNCQLQSLREVLAWSWFTNLGSLSTRLTTESIDDENQDTDRHATTYTAPRAAQLIAPTTRVRIWSILRDGRGASRDRVIDILIEK